MVTWVGAGGAAIVIGNGATVALPSLPTHAAGDDIVVIFTGKYDVQTDITAVDPTWVKMGTLAGGAGVAGNDTGPCRTVVFRHRCLTASEALPSFTNGPTAWNSATWQADTWRVGSGKMWADALVASPPYCQFVADTNTASPLSGTVPAFTGAQPTAGDVIFAWGAMPSDLGTALATFTMTATGLSGGTVDTTTRPSYGENANGADTCHVFAFWKNFTGTASAGVAVSTSVTSLTNHSGVIGAIALREVDAPFGATFPTPRYY